MSLPIHFIGDEDMNDVRDEAQSPTAPPATDADDATADRMCEYIAIAKSAESDSGKTSRLTALLRQEENHSLLECFRGEGKWHGHGVEAHFEGAPNWKVVIAKLAGVFDRGGDNGSGPGDRWGQGTDQEAETQAEDRQTGTRTHFENLIMADENKVKVLPMFHTFSSLRVHAMLSLSDNSGGAPASP
jgi:hypothetical protein